MKMLDLFCGRFGWGKAFAARGWEVVGIDLVEPPEVLGGCQFVQADIMALDVGVCGFSLLSARSPFILGSFDFICASSPCEQFSVHGMKCFHPNPPYPALGIKLFNHTRSICEASGVPYVMENVRAAQQFVGQAVNHCGPFYLWGSGVPPLMPQGIIKGAHLGGQIKKDTPKEEKRAIRIKLPYYNTSSRGSKRAAVTAQMATIPPELANCVADYAERICECPNPA